MHRIPIRGKALAITAAVTLGLIGTVAVTASDPAQSASDTAAIMRPSDQGYFALAAERKQDEAARKKAVVQVAQKKADAAHQAEVERKKAAQAAAKKKAAQAAARKKAAAAAAAKKQAAQAAARKRAAAARASRFQARQPIYSGDPRSIARSMLSGYGWSSSQFSCLDPLWARESGWNAHAANPSSGAYGIPQALPGSKMASAGADWQSNPATQIRWGLSYIKARYGSPCSAYSFQSAHGYY